MTLKEAVATFISDQGYTGRIFYGEQTTAADKEHVVIRDAGAWSDDPARYFKYPTIEIVVCRRTQQACDSLAATLAGALDAGGPLQLAPTYKVARATVPAPPESEGKDTEGIWTRSFSVNVLTHFSAVI